MEYLEEFLKLEKEGIAKLGIPKGFFSEVSGPHYSTAAVSMEMFAKKLASMQEVLRKKFGLIWGPNLSGKEREKIIDEWGSDIEASRIVQKSW